MLNVMRMSVATTGKCQLSRADSISALVDASVRLNARTPITLPARLKSPFRLDQLPRVSDSRQGSEECLGARSGGHCTVTWTSSPAGYSFRDHVSRSSPTALVGTSRTIS